MAVRLGEGRKCSVGGVGMVLGCLQFNSKAHFFMIGAHGGSPSTDSPQPNLHEFSHYQILNFFQFS